MKEPVATIVSGGFRKEVVEKVISLVNRSEYKRFQSPPILRVSSKAFGMGRRMPIVARY
jgi:NAD+ synthase (glutamine-hydrolysing)